MKYFLFLVSLFFYGFCISQAFEYKDIPKDLKPIDSLKYQDYFKNGKIRERGKLYKYLIEGQEYITNTGYLYEFYRDGTFKRIYHMDPYGVVLSCRVYLCGNEVWIEQNLVSIKTNHNSIQDYLSGEGFYERTYHSKVYNYSFKSDCNWLQKEGERVNGKKSKNWTIFNRDGSIKKIKNYNP